jgi:hypothetical protein
MYSQSLFQMYLTTVHLGNGVGQQSKGDEKVANKQNEPKKNAKIDELEDKNRTASRARRHTWNIETV